MARRVVSNLDRKHASFSRARCGKQLAYIADTRRERRGSLVPLGIILQQVRILLYDRSAAGRIDRDERRARAIEGGDVAPRQRTGGLEAAGVRVQRTAAVLPGSVDHRVAVDGQNAPRRPIGLVEQTVHHAATKHCRSSTFAASDWLVARTLDRAA